MAKSYDIASIEAQDGMYLSEQVRRKINSNFNRILSIVDSEVPSKQASQVTNLVISTVDAQIPEILAQCMDDAYPVGSVIVTSTSSDHRLSHGTWEQIGQGSYVLAAGPANEVMSTGGSPTSEVSLNPDPEWSPIVQPAEGEETEELFPRAVSRPTSSVTVAPPYIALLFYRRTA